MTGSAIFSSRITIHPDHVSILVVLQREYESYVLAMREKNIEHILSLVTPDFVWTLVDGTAFDRSQTEAAMEAQFQSMTLNEMSISVLEFELAGTEAIVVVQENSKGVLKAPEVSHFITVETIREVWTRIDTEWKIKASTVLQSQTLTMPITEASV